jgi:hypothetical protein
MSGVPGEAPGDARRGRVAEQPTRIDLRLHQGRLVLHRPRRPRRPVEPAGRAALRHPHGARGGHGSHRGVRRPRGLRERGQRKMAEILDGREWTGVVPFRVPETPKGGAGQGGARRGLCDADADRGGRAGRRLHRRRRPHPASHRDRSRRLAVDIRSISVRVPADRPRPAGPPGQPADRQRSSAAPRRPPRRTASGLSAEPRGRAGHRDPAPGPGDRQLHHGHARHRPVPGSEERRHWSINLYRVHSGSAAAPSASPGSAPTSPPAAPPPARPPQRGAISPF